MDHPTLYFEISIPQICHIGHNTQTETREQFNYVPYVLNNKQKDSRDYCP